MHANCSVGIHRINNGKNLLGVVVKCRLPKEVGLLVSDNSKKNKIFLFSWNKELFDLKGLRVVIAVHHQISTNEIIFVCA